MILTPFLRKKHVLEKQNIGNLKSETLHFPNVSTLMKISLGLILFTMISTVLVYAQTTDDIVIQIVENGYLEDNPSYLDNTVFSSIPGSKITVVNNDVVSHTLVSGSANSNSGSNKNYDSFLVCEFDPNSSKTYSNQDDNNQCDFNKDNRIIIDIIPPGDSVSFTITDLGTYRIIDPNYPWIEFMIYSFPDSDSSNNVNSGFLVDDESTEQTDASESKSTPTVKTLSVTVDGMPFDVHFSTKGLTVYEIESDTDSMSLIFYVDVSDSTGKLDVTFERSFFDSVYDGIDDQFFILSDGDETVFRETQTSSESRALSIDVPLGTEELEIIGSEFGFSKVVSIPIEQPVEEQVVEEQVVETVSTNECGPGTVLVDNVCVLDQRCGPGTVLVDNVCVLDSSESSSTESSSTESSSTESSSTESSSTESSSKPASSNKEIITSFSIAFAIAGVIGIILALIAKAHKKKD